MSFRTLLLACPVCLTSYDPPPREGLSLLALRSGDLLAIRKADEELRDEGLEGEKRVFIREVDLRYAGQGYEIRTPLEGLSNVEMSKINF